MHAGSFDVLVYIQDVCMTCMVFMYGSNIRVRDEFESFSFAWYETGLGSKWQAKSQAPLWTSLFYYADFKDAQSLYWCFVAPDPLWATGENIICAERDAGPAVPKSLYKTGYSTDPSSKPSWGNPSPKVSSPRKCPLSYSASAKFLSSVCWIFRHGRTLPQKHSPFAAEYPDPATSSAERFSCSQPPLWGPGTTG